MIQVDTEQQRIAARHLLQHPLTCAEQHSDVFSLIRRHEEQLDRWFTQRLGYRLHVTTATARLFKSTVVPHRRPLRAATATNRPLSQREFTMLTLLLAAVAAGPRVISLHDLVTDVRTAAADAEVTLTEEPVDRRALVTALKWMIGAGLATELHERIDRYIDDASADAVIEVDPDRVGLVPLPVLARAETAEQLLDRSDRRTTTRQWMRAHLVEDPVLYRSDLDESEWTELRRRLGEEDTWLDEMFGLRLESRAEGVAAIDPDGKLSDRNFPTTATIGHAALLFVGELSGRDAPVAHTVASKMMKALAKSHGNLWSGKLVDDPAALLRQVLDLLADNRLVEIIDGPGGVVEAGVESGSAGEAMIAALPAAARFAVSADDDAASTTRRRRPSPSQGIPQERLF